MNDHEWIAAFPGAITVCDSNGIITEMNDKARKTFADGDKLIGTSVLDCHPEPARTRVRELLETGSTNVYTIEKKGAKKLIYQAPWFKDGKPAGLVELSLEIPAVLPHHKRD
jgi:transcriptional regulator with PAS, ATPase and Fis domain